MWRYFQLGTDVNTCATSFRILRDLLGYNIAKSEESLEDRTGPEVVVKWINDWMHDTPKTGNRAITLRSPVE
ncbi:hypothetical protein V491_05867 [Pseudogymnoascus sp. VKM F-3775]|nr:hypothetical protein V491_05867 [Pseudogymnoascus sp. VKM F-3775]